MDDAVKTVTTLSTAALLLAASLPLSAQQLSDPTRPPARFDSSRPPGAAYGDTPQLQSVLLVPGQGGRRVAVIDGQTVRPGDHYQGARVVRISQGEVELVRGRERQVLKLNKEPLETAVIAAPPAMPGRG
jgi:MSHA biogenesis protein MshK